ncbi:hypothetical protein [Nocardia sp. NPDC056100]|uniref:hypothetical protein n=1 Tax=Nocardia sp. NPDC056100 TaxID=3345712 RepID=UPI0035D66262
MKFDTELFIVRTAHGRATVVEARRQLRSRSWVPSAVEQRVAYLLCHGSSPMENLDPYPLPAALWDRLCKVTAWSSRLRLAVLAGGWTEPGEETIDLVPDQVRLIDVLTAILQITTMIEPWEEEFRAHYQQAGGPTGFQTDHPGAFAAIEDAEEVLFEPSHIMDLLDEIWTGLLRRESACW